jgi:hypothetical protein
LRKDWILAGNQAFIAAGGNGAAREDSMICEKGTIFWTAKGHEV